MTLPISILIPCHNAEAFLRPCLQSAIAQDVAEIILLDDGSTDTSYTIALEYDDRVQVLQNDSNLGGAATRNRLFNRSTQPWVQYLDADDLLLPGKLETQFAHSAGVDVVYGDFTIERWDEAGQATQETWLMDADMVKALILFENPGQTNIFLYRRTLAEQVTWNETAIYRKGLIGHKYNLDLLRAGASFQHIPFNCSLYRRGWSPAQATDNSKAVSRMQTRLAFWVELKGWVAETYGTAEEPFGPYGDAVSLLEKRFQFEQQQLGMGQ